MDIHRAGSRPSGQGPAEYFTGKVRIDPIISTTEPARAERRGHVRARGAHGVAHASAGADPHRGGRVRLDAALGRPRRSDPSGRRRLDSPGREALARRHGHHIAVQEALDGKPVDWLEQVSDEQYRCSSS